MERIGLLRLGSITLRFPVISQESASIDFHTHSQQIRSAPTRVVSFELFRRSEQPTGVVHETICEQVHW